MAGSIIKRGVMVLSFVLIGWVVFISWQQFERHERIQEEIALLEAEAEKIRRENETFSERIQYFSTDSFREQEAKSKLGLKKENETVVVIKRAAALSEEKTESLEQTSLPAKGSDYRSHYEKWLALFFD